MMGNMFGIKNIKIRTFPFGAYGVADDSVNKFLKDHDGNIIDIQYQKSSSTTSDVMVIYADKENEI